ncbi:helix-turn-helix transcriptional regulator [Methylobacterium sp. WL7]|jgi:transcriptional regulator with XRE-family HTH domain|uniref:helix-turn-helix domain-containing protein n=1 Tax=Methylobacterium sp. WL7 TaxID=2603900 RepID=UPI0011CCC8EF|nr:helix-turn-helix transcriptional regulator [Methylobacterium sp. WL7]TXN47354.1 helix-turn-helix transcriptional regulator [Methylobacterium sp. WL7]
MLPTGSQIRAARSLLGISQEELAKRSRVSVRTLITMEKGDAQTQQIQATKFAVMGYLIGEGIRFVPDDEDTTSTRIGVILER